MASRVRAFIVGLSGRELLPSEADFLKHWRPWGVILFARNIGSRAQVAALTKAIRAALDAPGAAVLIDQEGGRVQRLEPPVWRDYPPAASLGAIYEKDREQGVRATWLHARLIAHDLHCLGITVDCLPVLDVAGRATHPVIAERSYGSDPATVAELGRAAARGLKAGGVLCVMKHIPGHGRAGLDSHHALPVVTARLADLRARDFLPFKALADLPIAMTAHILFKTVDPKAPATFSPAIINEVIRTEIGFEGLLLSDDLSMNALSGTIGERAARALEAGCDIALHCNGKLAQMTEVAHASPVLEGARLARTRALGAAHDAIRDPRPLDVAGAAAELDQLFGAYHG